MADNTPTPVFGMSDIVKGTDEAMKHYGLVWLVETVNTEPDDTGSVKVIASDNAQILSIADYDNFTANFPRAKDILLGIANGTSLRVMAQDVNRRNPKKSVEERRTAIVNRLAGVRNAGARTVVTKIVEKIVTVRKAPLPGGTFYEGENEVEYRAAYIAALVDQGVPAATATTIANTVNLPQQ
jgi:hypothetical protein